MWHFDEIIINNGAIIISSNRGQCYVHLEIYLQFLYVEKLMKITNAVQKNHL